jgi:excisionase family DNA binding protein
MTAHGTADQLLDALTDRVAEELVERLQLSDPPAPPEMNDQSVTRLAARLVDELVPALLPLLSDALAAQQAAAAAHRSLLSAQDLADRLGVSERTARQLLADREIPSLRVGGARRVEPHEVEAYLDARRRAAAAGD